MRGSLLTYLCEGGAFGAWQAGRGRGRYPDVLQERLRVASAVLVSGKNKRGWCQHKLDLHVPGSTGS